MSIVINNPTTVVDSAVTTAKLADSAVTTAKLADSAVTPAKLSTPLANKNYFKNPAFSIVQGPASGSITGNASLPTASLGYPGETEWSLSHGNGSLIIYYSFSGQDLTFTSASSKNPIILQRIESVDAARLAGKTVTVSVEVAPSVAEGNVRIQLYRPTTTADTHGTIGNSTQTLISDSGQISLTSTTSTRYSHTVTLPTTVNLGLEVRFTLAPGGSTANITFSRPKLEEGSTATAFTCDDVAVELVKCQRYFRSLSNYFIMYYTTVNTFRSEVPHPNMFGITRIRTLIAQNSINGAGVTIGAGLNENVTRVSYANNAGAGYYGGNPDFTVSAHIP